MVLCAGFGTRLRPLTDELPKPLLPLGDRSLLEHALELFAREGLGPRVVVNAHHLAETFVRHVRQLPFEVDVVREPEIRGTAGGIAGARALFDRAPVIVVNGDVLLDRIPPALVAVPEDSWLTLVVRPAARGAGTVGIGDDGRVVRLRGQTFGEERESGDYVGLCALGRPGLFALPEQGCLVQDFALPLLRRGVRIDTVPYAGTVAFPGDSLAGYLAENLSWLERRGTQGAHLGAGAQVAPGISIERSVIGAGARVEGSGRLLRCVVWPGASARAPLENTIVTTSGKRVRVEASAP